MVWSDLHRIGMVLRNSVTWNFQKMTKFSEFLDFASDSQTSKLKGRRVGEVGLRGRFVVVHFVFRNCVRLGAILRSGCVDVFSI